METTASARRLLSAVVIAVLVYSWFAAGFRPFTWPENVAVAIPILLTLGLICVRTPAPAPMAKDRVDRVGAAVWGGLLMLLVTWELIAFFSSPRDDHPTLSTIADNIMSSHPGRAVAFALWLSLGWLLFLRSDSTRR